MLEAPAPSAGRATHAPSRSAAWTASCLAVLLLATGLTLGLPQRSGFDVQVFFLVVIVLGFATIGQLIALSPTPSPIRWIYLGVAVCAGLAALAGALAGQWLEGGPVPRVVGLAGALYADLAWITWALVPTTFLLLLFPTGRLPSRRWLPVATCAVAGLGGLAAGSLLTPGPIPDFPSVDNPLGVTLPTWAEPVASVLLILAVLGQRRPWSSASAAPGAWSGSRSSGSPTAVPSLHRPCCSRPSPTTRSARTWPTQSSRSPSSPSRSEQVSPSCVTGSTTSTSSSTARWSTRR